jgi:hypothetical protein
MANAERQMPEHIGAAYRGWSIESSRAKIQAPPRTPARRILCDQHRAIVAYSVPN